MELPTFEKLTKEEEELLEIDRKLNEERKELPYYLELPPVRDTIERYSDKYKSWSKPKNKSLTKVDTDLDFFPEELHVVKDPTKKITTKMAKGRIDLEKRMKELEEEEADHNKRQKAKDDIAEDEDLGIAEDAYDDEQEEEEGDYIHDYYGDEDDFGGGDDSDGGGGGDY
ncbi:hypothetical protein HDV05_003080 [Chytridiales sp. JEL 0842]|nr:hypothetical protein HDV05_003080 [Chytridiales sp. JEL 0842]